MTPASPILESEISGLELLARGKVRDIYAVDDDHLLIVTSDRLSAYDVVMPQGVLGKGMVLTEMSNFWFRMMKDLVPNHLTELTPADVIPEAAQAARVRAQALVVRRLRPLPVEAVVRGYLIGSGWRDYQKTGGICGISLPEGLQQASALPETLFTPATKAAVGDHDENVDFATVANTIGESLATRIRDLSVAIYERASAYAIERGIIIADTKFEFGCDDDGNLFIIDEMLTPDSSRFWPADKYATGISPPSFDKQFVRDYLDTLDWDQTPPGPELPADVLQHTGDKYREALRILTR